MNVSAQSDFYQSFGRNRRKSSDVYLLYNNEDSPEQDFHPLNNQKRNNSARSSMSVRSHSDDRKWDVGTFGGNNDKSRNTTRREDLKNISRRIVEKSEFNVIEKIPKPEPGRFQRDCLCRDLSNYGITGYLIEREKRSRIPHGVQSLQNTHQYERERRRNREAATYDEQRRNMKNGKEGVWPELGLALDKMPAIDLNHSHLSSRTQSLREKDVERDGFTFKASQEKQARQVEGENNSELIRFLDKLRKGLLENNLHILDMKEGVYALLEQNMKLVQLLHKTQTNQFEVRQGEVKQEVERNVRVRARVEEDLDNIVHVVKMNEECAISLVEFKAKRLADVELASSQKETQGSSGGRSIRELDNGEEVKKLKEELKECVKIMEIKDKLIKKLTKQIKEMEEGNKVEDGNVQGSGLKNTAMKLIQLQKKVEKGRQEKGAMKEEIERLQKSLSEISGDQGMEFSLRESQHELRKTKDENDSLRVMSMKNEEKILELEKKNESLRTQKRALLQKIKEMEDSAVKNLSFNDYSQYGNSVTYGDTFGKNTDYLSTQAGTGFDHKKHYGVSKIDDLLGVKRISSIQNESPSTYQPDLLGQYFGDLKTPVKSNNYNNEFSSDENKSQAGFELSSPSFRNDNSLLNGSNVLPNTTAVSYYPDSHFLAQKILQEIKTDPTYS